MRKVPEEPLKGCCLSRRKKKSELRTLMEEHVEKPFHQILNGARNRMKLYLQDPGAKVTSGRAGGGKPTFHMSCALH